MSAVRLAPLACQKIRRIHALIIPAVALTATSKLAGRYAQLGAASHNYLVHLQQQLLVHLSHTVAAIRCKSLLEDDPPNILHARHVECVCSKILIVSS